MKKKQGSSNARKTQAKEAHPTNIQSKPLESKDYLQNAPVEDNPRKTIMQSISRLFSFLQTNKTSSIHKESRGKILRGIKSVTSNSNIDENEIFANFMEFGSKTAANIMIPRTDVFGVSASSSEAEICAAILENCHTRTLIYQDTLDNVLGFLHMKDLYCALAQKKSIHPKKLMRKHLTVAPSMKLIDLLSEMQKRKTHIAVVLDEYGGTDGIVTIEDVIEELVGKIEDEHDAEEQAIESFKLVDPSTILCNARVEIEEIEKALSKRLKKTGDCFETIGGLVLARAGFFPKAGTTIAIEDNIFAEVLESTAKSVKTIKITVR